jgi:urate oxidase
VIELGANRYGKAAIRLVRVARGEAGDRVRDLTVAIALEGDFEAAHTDGDNSLRRHRHDEEHRLRSPRITSAAR